MTGDVYPVVSKKPIQGQSAAEARMGLFARKQSTDSLSDRDY